MMVTNDQKKPQGRGSEEPGRRVEKSRRRKTNATLPQKGKINGITRRGEEHDMDGTWKEKNIKSSRKDSAKEKKKQKEKRFQT